MKDSPKRGSQGVHLRSHPKLWNGWVDVVILIHSVQLDVPIASEHWADAFQCQSCSLVVGNFQTVGTNYLLRLAATKVSPKQHPNLEACGEGSADQQGLTSIPTGLGEEVSFPSLNFCDAPFCIVCPITSSFLVGNVSLHRCQLWEGGRRGRRI